MAWSYSDSLSSPVFEVRFRVGDTDTNRQLLSNELIQALLTKHNSNVLRTSVICCRGILAMLSRDTNRSLAGISGSVDQMTTHYRDLLRDLIAEMNTEAGVYAGAIKISTSDAFKAADGVTMVSPDFAQGQYDI